MSNVALVDAQLLVACVWFTVAGDPWRNVCLRNELLKLFLHPQKATTLESFKASQQNIRVSVQLPTLASNVTLTAFTRHGCWALDVQQLWARAGRDGWTDRRMKACHYTDSAAQPMWAMPINHSHGTVQKTGLCKSAVTIQQNKRAPVWLCSVTATIPTCGFHF